VFSGTISAQVLRKTGTTTNLPINDMPNCSYLNQLGKVDEGKASMTMQSYKQKQKMDLDDK
jgi:hypothetical protein